MNPPYNAKPRSIPDSYKHNWTQKQKQGKEDPTKGLVFVKFISDVLKEHGKTGTKLAVLLPMSAAIGSKKLLKEIRGEILEDNTLEAVFSLPPEIFYPGASVQAVCMLFTLGTKHDSDNHETFFGYYKDDGFIKRKNMGRVEQFDKEGRSLWKKAEENWLNLFHNKKVVDGYSATHKVGKDDEWLAEAYMKTDYSKLSKEDFQQTMNDYLAYLVRIGDVYED